MAKKSGKSSDRNLGTSTKVSSKKGSRFWIFFGEDVSGVLLKKKDGVLCFLWLRRCLYVGETIYQKETHWLPKRSLVAARNCFKLHLINAK